MKPFTVLYTSAAIHSAIKYVFSSPAGDDRRIAIVAYLGKNAQSFLPHPRGLSLICNPDPASTEPASVRSLMKAGAKVQFSSRLHMKVYWSKHRGCVITSANASSNALGKGGLKEAGIFLPPNYVRIERLIEAAEPFDVAQSAMDRLERDAKRFEKYRLRAQERGPAAKPQGPSYLTWYTSAYPSRWKLFLWEGFVTSAKRAREKAYVEYAEKRPYDWANVKPRTANPEDWILCYRANNRGTGTRNLTWMYVDFVVPVARSDKAAYEAHFPHQAVQVHTPGKYPLSPFRTTSEFRAAFSRAVVRFGIDKLEALESLTPPKRLVKLIYLEMTHTSNRNGPKAHARAPHTTRRAQ